MKKPCILPFEKWLEEYYPDWDVEGDENDCPDCDGTGYVVCPECGQETDEKCDTCNGDGKEDITKKYREKYEAMKKLELELYENWMKRSEG